MWKEGHWILKWSKKGSIDKHMMHSALRVHPHPPPITRGKNKIIAKLEYRQPNKIMVYLTFHKWLVSVCNIHNNIWMVKTKTSYLGKVSYTILYKADDMTLLSSENSSITCKKTCNSLYEPYRQYHPLDCKLFIDKA